MPDNNLGRFFSEDYPALITVEEALGVLGRQFKNQLLDTKIKVEGIEVSLTITLTGQGGVRLWFVCPISGKRCRKLYMAPVSGRIGSRKALGLSYPSQTQKGTVEEVVRRQLKSSLSNL